jgi:dimethylargininase
MIALTRAVSPRLAACELLELERVPIDAGRAVAQHRRYVAALARLGARVEELTALPEHPDGVFVEDTAVVLPELAVITRPGVASRQAEVESTAEALARYRPLQRLQAPACLDGGDVLRVGRVLYVGLSRRTNRAGADVLAAAVRPYGYAVYPVTLRGCLHLKSAVSLIPPDRILINAGWVDPAVFANTHPIEVAADEPAAANTLTLSHTTLVSTRYPHTAERSGGEPGHLRVLLLEFERSTRS